MKTLSRFLAVATLAAIAAAPAFAALDKYKAWDKSPEFVYYATDDEKKAWKDVASDADAEKFVALFWARRDPDIKSPRNEFKERFELLVKLADERFPLPGRRGALTERGRVLILLGPPRTIVPRDVSERAGSERAGTDVAVAGNRVIQYSFVYEDKWLPAGTDLKKIEVVVEVDQVRNTETIINRNTYAPLEKKVVATALVHPELKEPPVYRTKEQAEAEQKAAADAATEAQKGPALTPAVRTALEDALGKTAPGPLTVMPIAFRDGATRLMLQITVPASAIAAPETTKLAVLVRDKEGKDAARLEEGAAFEKSKNDLFANRSVALLPGDYDAAAALVDASGAVVAAGRRSVTVTPVPTEFAASPLLIAYNDLEADPKKIDAPFAFSGRRFVARPDGKFDAKDGLTYAIRIYNPTVDPATKTAFIKRTLKVKPKNGSAIEVPGGDEKPTPVPELKDKGTLIIDLAGAIVDENLGDYFRAGEFELRITVTDQHSGKKIDASVPFTLAPKPPAPAPAKK